MVETPQGIQYVVDGKHSIIVAIEYPFVAIQSYADHQRLVNGACKTGAVKQTPSSWTSIIDYTSLEAQAHNALQMACLESCWPRRVP